MPCFRAAFLDLSRYYLDICHYDSSYQITRSIIPFIQILDTVLSLQIDFPAFIPYSVPKFSFVELLNIIQGLELDVCLGVCDSRRYSKSCQICDG